MRLNLDEERRQMIECAGGKVSDFYDAETKEWKKDGDTCHSHLVINAYDLCFFEHLIHNAYKAGLLDGIDEQETACERHGCSIKSAYKAGYLEGVNNTTKALRGETDD